uniref:C2H2-type domain-containing protein n=2 Tax=Cucumis sativus TaxID=3659 RepID=A0A0A0KZK2_CUCSA
MQLPDECPSGTLDLHSDILSTKASLPADTPVCVLKCKSVFKCKLCPRVVCLNEETLKAHLKSKRHARSEKLLNEGRLKIMLNNSGEIENPESLTESPPRLPAFPPEHRRRKNKSRQSNGSQAKRSSKKQKKHSNGSQMRGSTKNLPKKRRKIE